MKELAYIQFFEQLKKETPLTDYFDIFETNVEFKDPFHHTHDVISLYNIFQHMFKTVKNPSFNVQEYLSDGLTMYIRWQFSFEQGKKVQSFEGVSRVMFNDEGRVIKHIDYWDAAEHIYERIPIISTILKWIKNKIRQVDESQ